MIDAPAAHVLCVGGEDHRLRIPFMLALRDQGYRVTAAATDDAEPFQQVGITYHRFRFERFVNPLADRASIAIVRSLLKQTRPDIVQSFDTKPNVLVPLAARGIRDLQVVRTINGMGWVYSSSSPPALALRVVQRVLHRLAAQSVAATVFQNRQDQEFFLRHRMLGTGHNQLIPGSGIDIDAFERDWAKGASPAQLRAKLGLGTSEVVVTVTRLTRQKGIPTLLRAAALIHKVRPDVRFLLVGSRETEGRLAISKEEIERHSPYVMAIGQRADVPALLRLANVFAFPTEYREGIPRVLLEAGLAGLPIVTTNMPGCTDVVRDGWNGFLVRRHSPSALAFRKLDLLDDRPAARAMGERTGELVRREFGLNLTVSRYCSLYARLLRKARVSEMPEKMVPETGGLAAGPKSGGSPLVKNWS
ncbi:MAG: glycosyltransferase family 4 protein [Rhodopila sp.]|nr:glycosyltransferase family 4 protein [Rhodopila sp.]